MAVVDQLGQVPMFAGLGREQLEDLARHTIEIDVTDGDELTHEGRYEGNVFILLAGQVVIERDGRTVDATGAGDFFGEIAAVDGGPRTATVRAVGDCHLLAIPHREFNEILDADPEIRAAVMEAMEERLGRIDAEGAS